jgi:hypothetical protein
MTLRRAVTHLAARMRQQTTPTRSYEVDADEPTEDVEKLTEADTGRWRILTEDRIYIVDLDRRTVVGALRADAGLLANERLLSLRALHVCWVGDPGFWTMNTTGSSSRVEYWFVTAVIEKITRLPVD